MTRSFVCYERPDTKLVLHDDDEIEENYFRSLSEKLACPVGAI